jgi:glutaredoxin
VREAIVYWRPGCPFCVKLRLGLRLTRTPHRLVNIHEDAAAAAVVREHNPATSWCRRSTSAAAS